MAREGFGTDPSGRLAQGAPSSGGGGRGMSVGVGGGTSIGPGWKNGPMIVLKKTFKSGGKVDGKCDPQVAAFKNMIKDSAKPVKKACGGAAKVRKGMMKGK